MQKVRVYRGIEYIRLSQLPADEKEQIRNWLSMDMIIKIQTKEELMPDCVEYKNYSHWHEKIFTKISPAEVSTKKQPAKAGETKSYPGLAFE